MALARLFPAIIMETRKILQPPARDCLQSGRVVIGKIVERTEHVIWVASPFSNRYIMSSFLLNSRDHFQLWSMIDYLSKVQSKIIAPNVIEVSAAPDNPVRHVSCQ